MMPGYNEIKDRIAKRAIMQIYAFLLHGNISMARDTHYPVQQFD